MRAPARGEQCAPRFNQSPCAGVRWGVGASCTGAWAKILRATKKRRSGSSARASAAQKLSTEDRGGAEAHLLYEFFTGRHGFKGLCVRRAAQEIIKCGPRVTGDVKQTTPRDPGLPHSRAQTRDVVLLIIGRICMIIARVVVPGSSLTLSLQSLETNSQRPSPKMPTTAALFFRISES